MAEYIEKNNVIHSINETRLLTDDGKMVCCTIIRGFKAADVVEVKRGRWIGAEGETVGMVNGVPWSDCRCSVCGDYLTGSSEYPAKGNFCPNCGTDMREV